MTDSKFFKSSAEEDERHAYHTEFEQRVKNVLSPFQDYVKSQATASILLLLCTLIALGWASYPYLSMSYQSFVNTNIGFNISSLSIQESLQFWTNDVLLTVFFFFVGLEIKREFLVGELANHKTSLFIIIASLGGMIIPAFIYWSLNIGGPSIDGWGIPMATDTAFALGVLTCFRKSIPKGLFTFIAALAIIDDIGAMVVIATFYTQSLNTSLLFFALISATLLLLLNYAGYRKPGLYIAIGILMWLFIEKSGIHGTIAGIIIACFIPARPERGPNQFISRVKYLLKYFEKRKEKNIILEDSKQHTTLEKVQEVTLEATTPLQRWESKLEYPISLIILPLFALVNAGIPINVSLLDDIFQNTVSLGIILGLCIGKPLGVLIFSFTAYKCRVGSLPSNTSFFHILSASTLTGIGFTMSIFIANLTFDKNSDMLVLAKSGVIVGSVFSALLGIILLSIANHHHTKDKIGS